MLAMQFASQISKSIIPVVAGIEMPSNDHGERL